MILNDEVLLESAVIQRAERLLQRDPNAPPEQAYAFALFNEVRRMVAAEGFRRFGIDDALLDQQIEVRIAEMIREDGSLARFEERLALEGLNIETLRLVLADEYRYTTWLGVVTGLSPSPTGGLRVIPEPTVAEIRAAYEATPEEWEQAFSMSWTTLSFYDDAQTSGVDKANETARQLAEGEITLEAARERASRVKDANGDPTAMPLRQDLKDFLLKAEPGDVGHVDLLRGLGAQFIVLLMRHEARSIGFDEAQLRVKEALMEEKRIRAELRELIRLMDSSFTWASPDIENFLADMRRQSGVDETEVL